MKRKKILFFIRPELTFATSAKTKKKQTKNALMRVQKYARFPVFLMLAEKKLRQNPK